MTKEKSRTFPLPLSSVVGGDAGRRYPNTGRTQGAASNLTSNQGRSTSQRGEVSASFGVSATQAQQWVMPADKTAMQISSSMVSEPIRQAMVRRLADQGIRDVKVLAAMASAPRHMFVDAALAGQAYRDASLPIGHGQTISQPYIVARMIEILREGGLGVRLEKVLEIGTGCGYQALVLSKVAREVYSIERIKGLHELAKTRLRPLRVPNIRLHYGDGMLGLPKVAPFDGIILAAAGLEVPQALLEQLAVGGRLIAPVGGEQQVLQLVERLAENEWRRTTLETCFFVPLREGRV